MVAKINTTFLDSFPLFASLTEDEKATLASIMDYQVFSRYSFIYLPEDNAKTLFFLVKGTVKIGTHGSDGKEVIKRLVSPMSLFGEMGLVGEKKRGDFAQVLKDEVHLYSVPVHDFKRLMQQNFELCAATMAEFGSRVIQAENRLESVIFKDARARIVDFIKESIHENGRRVGYEMLLKHSLTHQDIANITCTSRQTVTLVLNELRKSDLIYFNRGKILVRDMERLA
jgi:CRP-like cAMP-binding protein